MRYVLHPRFKKKYKKFPTQIQTKVDERLLIFLKNESNPILKNHALQGEHEGCNSINITGDHRAIYFLKGDTAIFIRIGTHTELYP